MAPRILCTFPGRYGDLLWALPTVRAISQFHEQPVELCIAGEFESLLPLLEQQEYLADVFAVDHWAMTPTENWWIPPTIGQWEDRYDRVYHLGYRGWPDAPLPKYVYQQTEREYPELGLPELDLYTPWIEVVQPTCAPVSWTCGFTEAWFELKFGVWELLSTAARYNRLKEDLEEGCLSLCTGARWQKEAKHGGCGWLEAAYWIAGSRAFLGDCSALHVLACAVGTPVVCYEPMEARHNDIFYPYGKVGRVKLVLGNDGKPTIDSRHTWDTLQEVLAQQKET